MEKRIKKLRQHFIVCGFGWVGRNVAHELQKTGRPFVAIDPDSKLISMNTLRNSQTFCICMGMHQTTIYCPDADIRDAQGLFG